ncbi:MAG: hypothetical protein OXC40_03690 [Proteobacteria bacterium]|nr:hypothetical protein [Pseudomonadota bacterium]
MLKIYLCFRIVFRSKVLAVGGGMGRQKRAFALPASKYCFVIQSHSECKHPISIGI